MEILCVYMYLLKKTKVKSNYLNKSLNKMLISNSQSYYSIFPKYKELFESLKKKIGPAEKIC